MIEFSEEDPVCGPRVPVRFGRTWAVDRIPVERLRSVEKSAHGRGARVPGIRGVEV